MKHNSNKTTLIAFSSTLAVLVIVTLVCTALFAGASDEAEPANSVVNNNVVYVGFDKEPTEEDISAALAEWDRRREAANTNTDVSAPVVERTIYDIDKHISDDNPASIYVPVNGANYNVDLTAFIKERKNNGAYKINKADGVYRSASVFDAFYDVTEFTLNHSAFTGYKSQAMTSEAGVANTVETYGNANTLSTRSSAEGTAFNTEAHVVMNQERMLPARTDGILFNTAPHSMLAPTMGEYSIKDYGTYLGRKAFRVTGMNYPDKDGGYYVEKTGAYTYEFIFDVETNCTLATIFYGADGEITFYAVLTEFSTSSDIVVPELVK